MGNSISGYRLMWMLVMFDLPVGTKAERKTASGFRNLLLDEGFEMVQFSVYLRFVGERDKVDRHVRWISNNLPRAGKVDILFFTDKQFAESIFFENSGKVSIPGTPEKLLIL